MSNTSANGKCNILPSWIWAISARRLGQKASQVDDKRQRDLEVIEVRFCTHVPAPIKFCETNRALVPTWKNRAGPDSFVFCPSHGRQISVSLQDIVALYFQRLEDDRHPKHHCGRLECPSSHSSRNVHPERPSQYHLESAAGFDMGTPGYGRTYYLSISTTSGPRQP
jgi:hypothetical protein